MKYTKGIKHQINGIFGEVTYSDIDLDGEYYASRHSSEERSINTKETISSIDDVNGLPENISMDDYFKMALIQKLDNIEKKLNAPQNIIMNVSLGDISDDAFSKLAYLLHGIHPNKTDTNKV